MEASIIIPTLNRSVSLRRALSSITRQTFSVERYEIIVVDNGSTDDTRETVELFIRNHACLQIRYVYEPAPGLLAARHRGVREATAELLIFIDDDIEAVPGWLRAIVGGFDDVNVQLIGGRSLPRYEADPPPWLESFWVPTPDGGSLCWYLSLIDLGERRSHMKARYIWGLNFSIRRQAFYDLGGFHPDCFPESLQHFDGDGENGLTTKAEARGLLAIYEPAATIYHFVPVGRMAPEYFERRAFLQGIRDSYSAVRRNGGCRFSLWAQARSATGRVFRQAKWLARSGIRFRKNTIIEMQRRVAAAHRAGFDYHQQAIRVDPDVLDWVLRPFYWDYPSPG